MVPISEHKLASDFVPAGEMIRILMEDNGRIAKMIRNATTVCDENRIPLLVASKIFWTRQNVANGSFTKCCRDQRILNNLIDGSPYYCRSHDFFRVELTSF
jgi:hypothetical protein